MFIIDFSKLQFYFLFSIYKNYLQMSADDYCPGLANWIWLKTCSMLKLEPRAGGNSFKLARCFATTVCAGTITHIRSAHHLKYNGAVSRLKYS